jgi:hypothetical protein
MFNMFLRSCNQCFRNSGAYGVRVSGVIFGFCRFHFAREEKKKHKKPEAEKVKKSEKKTEDNKSEEDNNKTNRKRKLEEAQGEKPRRGRNTELQRRHQTLKKSVGICLIHFCKPHNARDYIRMCGEFVLLDDV